MTLLEPYLFVERLVVYNHAGSKVIDVAFHRGVNIIRGTNSSGKSTLLNFLFYGLGGDFSNWTNEAKRCEYVVVEVAMSGARLTLRRLATDAPRQAMQNHRDDEASTNAPQSDWKSYGYAQGEQRDSFSVVLFKALGFPEVRTEQDNSITMHQLLRLLYIDQDSPTQNLFRFERFDPPLMKQAIAELLLGVYDDALYNDRIALRGKQKEHDDKERELKSLLRLVASAGNEVDIVRFRAELSYVQAQLEDLNKETAKLRQKEYVKQRKNSPVKVERIQNELEPITKEFASLGETISSLQIEAFDSRQFIQSLERRVRALDDSVTTRLALGEIPLQHCPECLNLLEDPGANGNCVLCKHPLSTDLDKTQSKRLRQELDIQIRESRRLLDERQANLASLVARQKEVVVKMRLLQEELDLELKEFKSTRIISRP